VNLMSKSHTAITFCIGYPYHRTFEIGCNFLHRYFFIYYTIFPEFVHRSYSRFNSEQPFFAKKLKIQIFKFSLKVGFVRYKHVKGF
jgi:hypothetical protein